MPSPVLSTQFALIHGPNIPGSYAVLLFTASDFTSITSPIHNWVLLSFWLRLFILSGVISPLFSSSIWGTYQPEFIFQCHIFFIFSYCSWSSQGKNTEVVCHSLLQWTTFCQNSPPWPVHLGWPYVVWLIVSLTRVRPLWSVWLVFCDYSFHPVSPLRDKDKRLMKAF